MRKLRTTGLVAVLLASGTALAWANGIGTFANGVAAANPATGSPANVYSTDFHAVAVVTGTDPLENPSGAIVQFGHLSSGANTEPDENTYLTMPGLLGPASATGFDYGSHFLFQGHENAGNLAYVTRINLDVTDALHRITLLTPVGADGLTHFSRIDGSTFNPNTNSLFVTQEGGGADGGVVEISLGYPATITTHYGRIGRCGLEGIHVDNKGRIYLVEDSGGTSVSVDPNDINGATKRARQPNSYIFRFVPEDRNNISAGGLLQALQVSVNGDALTFGGTSAQNAFDDVWSQDQLDLHSGMSFPTRWVKVHSTEEDGTADFDCNLAARAAGATPFKRPENGVFKPDGLFQTFFFTITGDTDKRSGDVAGLQSRGAYGGIFELDLDNSQNKGSIHLFALGDADHNSFDNITFGDSQTLLVAEDRGDTLHDQLNKLDSLWAYPLNGNAPLRVVAQGRDVSATPPASEDNEVTGIHVSNGTPTISSQFGTPNNLTNARGFFTQQHGDNTIYELIHN